MRSGGDQFDRTLELIYDVAVMPSLWPGLLGRLGTALQCHFFRMVTSSAKPDERAMNKAPPRRRS